MIFKIIGKAAGTPSICFIRVSYRSSENINKVTVTRGNLHQQGGTPNIEKNELLQANGHKRHQCNEVENTKASRI